MSGALGKAVAGVFAVGGAAFVYKHVTAEVSPEAEAAMPADVKASKLKKTLSNAGLYPQPETPDATRGRLLKSQPSGRMTVFTEGAGSGAALNKGGGDPM